MKRFVPGDCWTSKHREKIQFTHILVSEKKILHRKFFHFTFRLETRTITLGLYCVLANDSVMSDNSVQSFPNKMKREILQLLTAQYIFKRSKITVSDVLAEFTLRILVVSC